jgi:PAS domain S-box-containing protein
MAAATRRISEGNYKVEQISSGYSEIDQILEAFRVMAAALEKRERDLRESEARYRDLFENAVDIIYSLSPSGVIVDANEAFLRQGGYEREEVEGRPLGDFLVQEDRDLAGKLYDRAAEGEAFSFEMRGKTKTGEIRWYSVISRPILDEAGALESIHCIARDITERRKAEEELKRSEKRFRDLFDSVSDLVYTQDIEGRFLTVNRALTRITGYDPEEFEGRLPSDFMKPELKELFSSIYIKELKEKGFSRGTSVYLSKDGRKIYIEYVSNLVVPEHGDPYISGIARDVTDKVLAMRAIREREERISAILEATPVPTVVYDTEGKLQFMNSAFTEVFGWEAGELSGKRIPFVPEEEAQKTIKKIEELYREGKSGALETKRFTKDGRILDVIISAALIRGESGRPRGMVVSLTDLTEQKRLEAALQQAQKLEAIGVLAGGIAHDFNNLLMAIQGNTSLMLMDTDRKAPSYQRLKDIEKYVEQGASLTRQLLGFARGGRYEIRPLDLNSVIRDHDRIFSRTRKDIVIEEEFEEGLWQIEADKGQMLQILMNLYVNAAQAMSEGVKGEVEPMKGGTIRVRTKNVFLEGEEASHRQMEPGRYVLISVADTGKGMDRETLARIFEPFFTTKERGRGTGLGLASVYGIVKGHGGHVEAESEPGKGSEFRIFLPAADIEEKAGKAEQRVPDAPVKGKGTILLVDDEEMILDVGKTMLERLGYDVVIARGGEKALSLFREKAREIDLVILDIIMPKMSGDEVFVRLKEIKPDVKVLVSSGYSMDGSTRNLMESGCLGFIQKPFSLAGLSTKVAEALA